MKPINCFMANHAIYIQRYPNGKHAVSPCCIADNSEPTDQPINFNNDPYLTEIRESLQNGIQHPACHQCWKLEEKGGESRRLNANDIHQDFILDGLMAIDYNVLPICNAKCIICNPTFSSIWATDTGAWEIKDIVKTNHDHLEGLDLSKIVRIYFNGGEPLLTNEHLVLLRKVNNAIVFYNTNGSCYPSEETIELWKKQKYVSLGFSIDAVGENFNRIRERLDWAQVSNNILKIHQELDVGIECSYTLGGHNIYDLEPTIEWFSQIIDVKKHFHVHYVSPGHELYFDNFKDQHDEFRRELEKFKDFHWCDAMINALR